MSYDVVQIKEIIEHNPDIRTFKFDRFCRPHPGQFAMVLMPGIDEKPFSFSGIDEMIIEKRGSFTEKLFQKEEGDILHVRGPLGQQFPTFPYLKERVGIAGGCGVGPISFLAKERGQIGTLLYGARTADGFADLPNIYGLEVVYATDDGTKGHNGLVTDLIPEHITTDNAVVGVCGPEIMMKKVHDIFSEMEKRPAQSYFSLERYMKCGEGICGACSCSGYLVCSDGPVFSFDQLLDMPDFGHMRREKSGGKVEI